MKSKKLKGKTKSFVKKNFTFTNLLRVLVCVGLAAVTYSNFQVVDATKKFESTAKKEGKKYRTEIKKNVGEIIDRVDSTLGFADTTLRFIHEESGEYQKLWSSTNKKIEGLKSSVDEKVQIMADEVDTLRGAIDLFAEQIAHDTRNMNNSVNSTKGILVALGKELHIMNKNFKGLKGR